MFIKIAGCAFSKMTKHNWLFLKSFSHRQLLHEFWLPMYFSDMVRFWSLISSSVSRRAILFLMSVWLDIISFLWTNPLQWDTLSDWCKSINLAVTKIHGRIIDHGTGTVNSLWLIVFRHVLLISLHEKPLLLEKPANMSIGIIVKGLPVKMSIVLSIMCVVFQ